MKSPLVCVDGVAPSYIAMPAGRWATVLEFVTHTCSVADIQTFKTMLSEEKIFDQQGNSVNAESPYQPHQRLWYHRTLVYEKTVPDDVVILYRDANIVVADKPHFLSTVPAGRHIKETLLARLRVMLQHDDVAPVHRLDRETAGIVIFCLDARKRGAYQTLFENRQVEKIYEAIAPFNPSLHLPVCYRSRLENVKAFITVHNVEGEPNSETFIELLESSGQWGRYKLAPKTGKKHQLRAHLSALGIPIVNDPWYPKILDDKGDDFTHPLQLLAKEIAFVDPFSGQRLHFKSGRVLNFT